MGLEGGFMADVLSANGEEKQAKEYGKMVLFVMKHSKLFLFLCAAVYGAWQTVQAIKFELALVQKEVTELKTKIDKFDDKLERILRHR